MSCYLSHRAHCARPRMQIVLGSSDVEAAALLDGTPASYFAHTPPILSVTKIGLQFSPHTESQIIFFLNLQDFCSVIISLSKKP